MVWSEESGVKGSLFLSRSINTSMTYSSIGWQGEVGVEGVSSRKVQASSMVRVNEVGMEKSESEGWLSVSEGLVVGIVTKMVHIFKVSGAIVVTMVDSANVEMGMGIVT